jgi:ATP-binding cassette subfamily C protein
LGSRSRFGSIFYDQQDIAGLIFEWSAARWELFFRTGRYVGRHHDEHHRLRLLTVDDAWEAARMCGLDDDIRAMPMGMHTVLSEGGSTLSGGQKQR